MLVSNLYFAAKALHLIGMVSWMSGAFYLVRILVYHVEALARAEPERSVLARQFATMEGKVYNIILKPAVVITWTFGSVMLAIQPGLLLQGWLLVKLAFVLGFTVYTWRCGVWMRELENGTRQFSHVFFRAMNEVPTIILAAVVFLAVYRHGVNWFYLVLGLGLFSFLIFSAVRKVAKKQS